MEVWTHFLEVLDPAWVAENCLHSLRRVVVGVLIALGAGVAMGLLRSALPLWAKGNPVLKFLFEAPKFPPPIAWIPFVILAFGVGETSAYAIVFIGAFSPIFTSAYEGAESVPAVIKNTARSLGVSGLRLMGQIVFMSALPQIFTGLRVGLSMGWMSVIAAEMISGQSGLGYSIQLNRLNLQCNLMTLDMILIGVIGFVLFQTAVQLERLVLPWHERSKGAS